MPQTPHVERHFTGGETVRDVVVGMSDGLTVPFALAAGLSGGVASAHVVVVAGLAEIAAGSIAMGLGGFLAATSDAEHYEQELVPHLFRSRSPGLPAPRRHRINAAGAQAQHPFGGRASIQQGPEAL